MTYISLHYSLIFNRSMLISMLLMTFFLPSRVWAQDTSKTQNEEIHTDTLRVPLEQVTRAHLRAELDAWDAQSSFRRGQYEALRGLDDPDSARRLVDFSLTHALDAAIHESQRVYVLQLPVPVPDVEIEQNVEEDLAALQNVKQAQAQLELEQARQKEAAEQDFAQKALLKRKRELAEARVAWTEQQGAVLLNARQSLREFETSWTTFIEPIHTAIEAFPSSLTQSQRQTRVDPIMDQLILHRRELWKSTAQTRDMLFDATEKLVSYEQDVEQAQQALDELKAQPIRTSALRQQRLEVHDMAVKLAQDQRDQARQHVEVLDEHLALQNQHVDEISMTLRRVLPVASAQAHRRFYDLFEAQNWHDATELLHDRIDGWRSRLTQRWLMASNMRDRLASVLLWVFALLPRLFLFVIASVILRFIPAVLRKLLDMMLGMTVFRRRPGWAIKIYEVSRVSFKPVLYFWVTSLIFDYILLSFPEAIALWGAIEAGFVFWFVDRIARTLFFSRSRREESGYASSGEIDDLTPTEARMADVFLLEQALADRAVRSVRSVALLVIAWTWILDLLYAVVGYSVISFLIRWVLVLAIFTVTFGFLSRWRTEIAQLFGRMLGTRAPNMQAFVTQHKDKPWGVAVIAGAALVVIVGEAFYFVRRHVLSMQAIRQLNNFIFARKVELQSRLEEKRFEPAVLTQEQYTFFEPHNHEGVVHVERGLQTVLDGYYDAWKTRHRQGSVICKAERGVGVSTLLSAFSRTHEAQVHNAPHIHHNSDIIPLITSMMSLDQDFEHLEALTQYLLTLPEQILVLDNMEHMFVRTVGGYDAVQALCQLISDTDHVHFWVVGCNQQAWDFLQKISELGQYFGHELELNRWRANELRELLLARTSAADITITFQSLDASATGTSVVKTEEGYFRYMEDFVRGNPAAALHYWCQSLCVEELGDADYSVQLFERRHAQQLTRLNDRHAFVLSALAHYSNASLEQLAQAVNMSPNKCRTLLDRLDDMDVIRWQEGTMIRIDTHWYPLVLRYLSDSNLLIS